jgi:hypothetical protein
MFLVEMLSTFVFVTATAINLKDMLTKQICLGQASLSFCQAESLLNHHITTQQKP